MSKALVLICPSHGMKKTCLDRKSRDPEQVGGRWGEIIKNNLISSQQIKASTLICNAQINGQLRIKLDSLVEV